jgi:hypothetical protein
MKMAVFWDIAPCSLTEVNGDERSTSESSVNFSQNTRRNIPEDRQIHVYDLVSADATGNVVA